MDALYALSDLHVDFAANMEQLASLSTTEHRRHGLLVAGDVSHRLDRTRQALELLVERFGRVYLTPGNHDLWVDDGEPPAPGEIPETSVDRLDTLLALCRELGVVTQPAAAADGLWVVPLFGWYESAFHLRLHADAPADRIHRRWADHKRCRWPAPLAAADAARAAWFDGRNDGRPAPPPGAEVITFSHFLPRPELLPPVRSLRFKELPHVAGSERLETRLRALRPRAHVFGHTHIPWDETIEGVRYLQNPLAYPYERQRRGQAGLELVRVD